MGGSQLTTDDNYSTLHSLQSSPRNAFPDKAAVQAFFELPEIINISNCGKVAHFVEYIA